jgi:hypothetical protein
MTLDTSLICALAAGPARSSAAAASAYVVVRFFMNLLSEICENDQRRCSLSGGASPSGMPHCEQKFAIGCQIRSPQPGHCRRNAPPQQGQ